MKRFGKLWLLLAAFALPVGLAQLMLSMQWYQGGVTNRGQLLDPPLSAPGVAQAGRWQLLYVLPDDCDVACAGALFHLRQIPQAVGAERDRVASLLLVNGSAGQDNELLRGLKAATVPASLLKRLQATEYGAQAIYLVDPLGNILMAYPLESAQPAILAQGKDVLRDLKRLLKVSKIG
ncbi:cytochrome oxidase [Photobacterium atrarenae]|uniref:Cytochrome oxidase n=1 Tax=Photobacterium atrarenae TaxID=865757 RepID=A0ABY5GFF8_9GAMM|nr:cytochrome oxidase [Photobacterium atrarenae]UTV27855.1 cytochrome oxidase [Photobacterium atrarenae]